MTASRVPRPADLGRKPVVGVLALQGDFDKHLQALTVVGAVAETVRTACDLESIDALVIPGGESTTLLRLVETTGMRKELEVFLREKPALGTCAGLILMAIRRGAWGE